MAEVYDALNGDERTALTAWKSKVETIVALGNSEINSELNFWLNGLGFKIVSGGLTLPGFKYSTSTPWNNSAFGNYLQELHYWNRYNDYYGKLYGFDVLSWEGAGLKPAYQALFSQYPIGRTLEQVLNAQYNRLQNVFTSNSAFLTANGIYNNTLLAIIGGLMLIYEFFAGWSSWYYKGPTGIWAVDTWFQSTGTFTIGPYTVTVSACENGRIYNIISEVGTWTDHQSVDADILLQDEAQVELAASQLLAARVPSELDADTVLQARVDTELSAELPLMGEVQLTPIARLALWDKVTAPLDADEWLAATHQLPCDAYERLAAMPRIPVDADICIQGPVPISITARMYLEPDFKSEMLTDLERLHIQKYRIVADPRSYVEYNSEKDVEVVP